MTFNNRGIYIGCTCEEFKTQHRMHLTNKGSHVYKNRDKEPKIGLITNATSKDKNTLKAVQKLYIEIGS